MPRFAGEDVTVGGTTYVVPPLGFLQLKTLLPIIERISVSDEGDAANVLGQLDDILALCLGALNRNYPDLTRDGVLEALHAYEMPLLVSAVMRQSNLGAVKEKNGVAVESGSTGPVSTDDSPPPLAGPGSTSTSA